MSIFTTALFALVSGVLAAPAVFLESRQENPLQDAAAPWDAGAVSQYPIHSSCNATQEHQITVGLNEAIALADHAKNHVLRWGNESDIYRKYFGNRPVFEVIGSYDIIVSGDKAGVLFRCDNPDGNCALEGWGGHWRGENATSETVICDLSYETRRSLSQMCALGYTVAGSPRNTFWASDLLHRLYHVPAVGAGYIEHFAEGYEEILEFAQGDGPEATHDTDVLQYFALEAYAFDIAVPGVGCVGEAPTATEEAGASSSTTLTSSATPAPQSATGSPTVSQPPSTTSDVPEGCHTHEDGVVHCP